MRLDKFLKVARVIKRRSVANDVCSAGRVSINGRTAKPGTEVKPGDIIDIGFGQGNTKIKVMAVKPTVRKEEAAELFEIIESGK